jgi:hypothetical protein
MIINAIAKWNIFIIMCSSPVSTFSTKFDIKLGRVNQKKLYNIISRHRKLEKILSCKLLKEKKKTFNFWKTVDFYFSFPFYGHQHDIVCLELGQCFYYWWMQSINWRLMWFAIKSLFLKINCLHSWRGWSKTV